MKVLKSILKFIKSVFKITLFVILLGLVTAGIDYTRIINGETPLFNISSTNIETNKQTFQGIFYTAERKVRISDKEPLMESKNIKYNFLTKNIKVPKQFKEETFDFKIEIEEEEECQNKIEKYYEGEKIDIYTNCLKSLKIQTEEKLELKEYIVKNTTIMNQIINKLGYMGMYKNTKTLVFETRENDSSINKRLTIYKCDNEKEIYYIGNKEEFYQDTFCKS
ncbi:MAG: hypothetical protein IKE70_05500 [Bacilli bacterium]|nr:hypothetical protein [Bacilli bacterium]